MPSECRSKDEVHPIAPLRSWPAAVSLQPRCVAPVRKSALRVFAGAPSLGRRGERLAVAVETPPGPRRVAHDSGSWALGLRRARSGVWSLRHLSPAARGGGVAARVVMFFFLTEV